MTIDFTKMHGLGNDYIYIDTDRHPIADPSTLSVLWSQPHTGIGSDGIILISRSDVADFKMRIFNADGTEALMCGNGSRCVGKYVYDKGLTDKTCITLETLSGIKRLDLMVGDDGLVSAATVDMGTTSTEDTPFGLSVDMGNPHCVVFVDDISAVDVTGRGREIEFNPMFPGRTNVEFVEVRPDGSLRMRVWERGSGITQACGTGACATAVAACVRGFARRSTKADNDPIRVVMDGGELLIRWDAEDGHVYMTGPATTVFEGRIEMK